MKTRYLLAIGILIIVALVFAAKIFNAPQEKQLPLGNAVHGVGLFASLLAVVIALHAADPKRKKIKLKVDISVDMNNASNHNKENLSEKLKEFYKDFPDPFQSHRVQFKITNKSGFDLIKPVFTFRLPLEKRHPYGQGREKVVSRQSFNSNLFNSQRELVMLEMTDTQILSNSNLTYLNKNEHMTFWFRMVLGDGKLKPFNVNVSVNCENAEGFNSPFTINPRQLLKTHKKNEPK